MWVKDQNGNWYMASQSIIKEASLNNNIWVKDGNGQWLLAKSNSMPSMKTEIEESYYVIESLDT